MIVVSADKRPHCVAFVHPTMGSMDTCGKFATWVIHSHPMNGDPNNLGDRPICVDHANRTLSLLGALVDNVTFDLIVVDK